MGSAPGGIHSSIGQRTCRGGEEAEEHALCVVRVGIAAQLGPHAHQLLELRQVRPAPWVGSTVSLIFPRLLH